MGTAVESKCKTMEGTLSEHAPFPLSLPRLLPSALRPVPCILCPASCAGPAQASLCSAVSILVRIPNSIARTVTSRTVVLQSLVYLALGARERRRRAAEGACAGLRREMAQGREGGVPRLACFCAAHARALSIALIHTHADMHACMHAHTHTTHAHAHAGCDLVQPHPGGGSVLGRQREGARLHASDRRQHPLHGLDVPLWRPGEGRPAWTEGGKEGRTGE